MFERSRRLNSCVLFVFLLNKRVWYIKIECMTEIKLYIHWVTKFLTWWCVFIATYNGTLSHISVADEQQLLVGFRSHLCYFTILQFLASCCFHNSKLELWKAIWKETEIWVQHKSRCISNFDRCGCVTIAHPYTYARGYDCLLVLKRYHRVLV